MTTKAKQGVSSAVSSVSKHTSKKDIIEKAVFKATQSTKEEPPKDKYMRTILEDTHILGSGSFTFQEIFKRPVAEKELILFKTIYIVHKMMRDGAPKCCKDIQTHESFLKSMHSQYKGVHTQYGAINAGYLAFLVQKIEFHRKYPDVTGDVDPYKYKERGQKKNTPKEAFDLCVSILDLQKMVLAVEQKILQTGSLNPCKVCPIVPLLYESFNLYNFAVSLLNSLVVYEESDPLIDLFNKQFPVIQKFYFQCTTIPYITAIVARIPELSSVPLFELKGEKKRMDAPEPPKVKKPKKKKSPPPPQPVEFPQPPPMFTNINPFATSAPNPFQIDPMQLERERLAREAAERAAREAAERAAWEAAERDRLAREAAERAQRAAWEAAERDRLAREQAERERLAREAAERAAREAAERAAREAADRAAREQAEREYAIAAEQDRVAKENRDALKRRIAELEALCRETEGKIKDMNGQNDELRRMLSSTDGDIQEVQLSMNNRLNQQKEAFLRANGALKAELDQLVAQNQADKAKLLSDTKQQAVLTSHTRDLGPGQLHTELEESAAQELQLAGRTIEGISQMLGNVQPSGPASQRTAAQSIVDASQAITLATKLLVGAATEQQHERLKQLSLGLAKPRDPMWTEGLLQAAKALSDAVKALSDAAVLAAQGKIDDAALTGAARAVAAATAQLIMASREGSGEDSEALQRAADAITRATRGLVEAARMVGTAEEMAAIEKSNAEASKSVQEEIEQAANILRIQQQIDRTQKKLQEIKNTKSENSGPAEKKVYGANLEEKTAAREATSHSGPNNKPPPAAFRASSPRDFPPPTSEIKDFGTPDNPFAPTFLPPPPADNAYNPFLS